MRYNRPHYFLFLKPFSITNSTQTSISTTTTITTTTITNLDSNNKQIKLTNQQQRLLFNLKHIINVNIEIKNNNKSYNKIGLHLIDVSLKLMNNLRRII